MIPDGFWQWQTEYRPSAYLLAFSGGRDSVALLDALYQRRGQLSAPLELCHINHGWHPSASSWGQWCKAQAARYALPLQVVDIEMGNAQGHSREALAREKRYAALAARLPPRGVLLTAHHRSDQAETFLLAALRGSGLEGLAAMPARRTFAQGELWRPFLALPRTAIDAYVADRGLDFIEDPSNADTTYRRNALRKDVFPHFYEQGWQADKMLAQSAQWLGEALMVQRYMLDQRLPQDVNAPLPWPLLAQEPAMMRKALLRRFLQRRGAPAPPAPRLEEWLRQAQAGRGEPLLRYAGWCLLFYRRNVYLYADEAIAPPPEMAALTDWPGVGRLRVQGRWPCGAVWALARGGMRFHPHGAAHAKTLKDAFQRAGIPCFARRRTPVLLADGQVLWAGHLGLAEGAEDLRIEWQERPCSASIRAYF